MVWFRIYFQAPRGSRFGELGRTVLAEGEAARDQILSRKRPKVAHWEVARIHECAQCGRCGPWSEEWSWWGSWRDMDDGKPVVKLCSASCREEFETPAKPQGGRFEPHGPGEDADRYAALRIAREAPTAHRKVPMPKWPGPGTCRWCLEPTIWESGKRKGQPAPARNWHNACYYEYQLHTELAAQFSFLFQRDGPRCQICGDGGYASAGTHVDKPEGMSWADYMRLSHDPDAPRYTILKPKTPLEVDHVVPLWRVWSFRGDLEARQRWHGPLNLWLLCIACHKAKSAIEATERAADKRSPAD